LLTFCLGDHVFGRDAEKVQKTASRSIDGPKLVHFLASKFCLYFSGNPQNVGVSLIFGVSKTLEKMMKITRFDLLRGPFIDRDQASRREPKIMQNHAKMHPKSPQNEHEKTWIPILQWPKIHPNP